jgi:RimJ/RimL family protein N-acetyltransferase
MDIWEGKLVRLRAVEPGDWETFQRFNHDSEATRDGYFIPLPRSREHGRQSAAETAEAKPDPASDIWRFAIESLEGELTGTVNTHSCDRRNGTFEYGITLGREFWGRGYAADALCLLARHYFNELRYQKLNAIVYAFNERSIRFHETFGFTLEGTIRRNLYTDGQYHDVRWYGLTAEEFRQRHPGFAASGP